MILECMLNGAGRLIVFFLFVTLAHSAIAADVVEQRCREFIAHLVPVHQISSGTQVSFTGRFAALPRPLEDELTRLFPDLSFRIAEMSFVHWAPEPV